MRNRCFWQPQIGLNRLYETSMKDVIVLSSSSIPPLRRQGSPEVNPFVFREQHSSCESVATHRTVSDLSSPSEHRDGGTACRDEGRDARKMGQPIRGDERRGQRQKQKR